MQQWRFAAPCNATLTLPTNLTPDVLREGITTALDQLTTLPEGSTIELQSRPGYGSLTGVALAAARAAVMTALPALPHVTLVAPDETVWLHGKGNNYTDVMGLPDPGEGQLDVRVNRLSLCPHECVRQVRTLRPYQHALADTGSVESLGTPARLSICPLQCVRQVRWLPDARQTSCVMRICLLFPLCVFVCARCVCVCVLV